MTHSQNRIWAQGLILFEKFDYEPPQRIQCQKQPGQKTARAFFFSGPLVGQIQNQQDYHPHKKFIDLGRVGIYVYSPDSNYYAPKVLKLANTVLKSAGEFIKYAPVSHYNFLMVFLDEESYDKIGIYHSGALEHSYSSLYYFPIDEE